MSFPVKPSMWCPGIRSGHPLAQGLEAFYPLWEGSGDRVMDLSSGAVLDTWSGAVWTPQPSGTAIEFDQGGPDYIQGTMPAWWSSFSTGTVVLMFTPYLRTAQAIFWLGDKDTPSQYLYIGQAWADDLYYELRGAGGYELSRKTAGNEAVFNTPMQVALVQDGVQDAFYVNSKLTATADVQPSTDRTAWFDDITAPDSISFGMMRDSSPAFPWSGALSLAAIYSRALSAGEIEWLYREPWDMITHPTKTYFFLTAAPAGNRRRRVLICGRRRA